MDVNQMTFGIEIETTIPYGAVQIGSYQSGLPVANLPQGWVAKYDGSIHASRGRQGCEFVSPVLRGADGLRQIIEVCRTLNSMGAKVNRSTGLHVHVGFDRTDADALKRLVTLTANFEKAIYASTGTKNRERGGYSAPISPIGSADQAINLDRYRVLNVTNLRHGGKPTVEFRAFAGTLNAEKIIGYVRLCLGLVERAVKAARKTNWTAKAPVASSPIHRKGEGATQLTRLFYQLGWTKGRTQITYGDVTGEGLPAMAASKKALMKLARKYDGQN